MPVIEVNDRAVHVQELNRTGRQTVVLVHGMFSNLSVYYFNIAPLLAENFRVLMYDLRSHGLSERVTSGYDLENMAADLLALLDRLALERVCLAGYSYGGLVALKAALDFPQRVNGLAVIDAPDPGDQKTRDIIDVYSREFLENYINNFTDTTRIRMGKRQFEKNHRMYEFLFNETSIRQDMLRDTGFLNMAGLDAIKDVLLVYGTQSNCLDAGNKLHQRIRSSALTLIEGDHNVPVQQPAAVAAALNRHFSLQQIDIHG